MNKGYWVRFKEKEFKGVYMKLKRLWPFRKNSKAIAPTKRALCVGINDYPRNKLNGCVNDAKEWANLLKTTYGFTDVKIVLDRVATAKNVKDILLEMVKNSKDGDVLVFTYSGHGTNTPDRNGDELDRRDEAMCCYDKLLIDDELRAIISQKPAGVSLSIISDSCFSGTVTRAFMEKSLTRKNEDPVPRFMPPEDIDFKAMKKADIKPLLGEEEMAEILLSGCNDKEYSYDANIFGKPMGAMSAYAIKIIQANPKITWQKMHTELRKKLPSRSYPQSPQLEGSKQNKSKPLFT